MKKALPLLALALLSGCVTAPTVDTSRQALWTKYGNHPLDDVLLAWGPPTAETKLATNARLATYEHVVFYRDSSFSYQCRATFLAPPPSFKVTNIALDGDPTECYELSLGNTRTDGYDYAAFPHRRLR